MQTKCRYCGNVFTKNSASQKYCSHECFLAMRREQKASHKKSKKTDWNPADTQNEIVRICREAKEAGMSYGQYVSLAYACKTST